MYIHALYIYIYIKVYILPILCVFSAYPLKTVLGDDGKCTGEIPIFLQENRVLERFSTQLAFKLEKNSGWGDCEESSAFFWGRGTVFVSDGLIIGYVVHSGKSLSCPIPDAWYSQKQYFYTDFKSTFTLFLFQVKYYWSCKTCLEIGGCTMTELKYQINIYNIYWIVIKIIE